jgi:phosphate transport system substrate-binding protein
MQRHRSRAVVALIVLMLILIASAPAHAGGSHALIQGSGSGWSANAVNQWVADVEQKGLRVVYTAVGSAQGRKDFAYKTTDYAVSDIGYLGSDPITGEEDTSLGRAYVYLPIVAGGTAFPYQVRVGGKLVRNIRLSGQTVAKIFTNRITRWSDPAITNDNNGRKLPAIPIIPVVHSEGAGTTAQFTRWLAKQYSNIWRAYSGSSELTEYYPRKGQQIAQNGSDGVMNFVTSAAANGAIGYDEFSYALAKNYPVAKVLNRAGYFTAPTQYNVAVALTKAKINEDRDPSHCKALGYTPPCYLLQNLDAVYTHLDKRAYPLSSYSYMIIPTASDDARMTTAKRQTLADFLYYAICQGQAEMGPIGYSPLPINLVQASFNQVATLKAADPGVDLNQRNVTTCHNPTFVPGQPRRNYLAEIAPLPPLCDKLGEGPCTGNEGLTIANPKHGKVPTATVQRSAGPAVKGSVAATAGPSALGTVAPLQRSLNLSLRTLPGSDRGSLVTALAAAAGLLLVLALAVPRLVARSLTRRESAS